MQGIIVEPKQSILEEVIVRSPPPQQRQQLLRANEGRSFPHSFERHPQKANIDTSPGSDQVNITWRSRGFPGIESHHARRLVSLNETIFMRRSISIGERRVEFPIKSLSYQSTRDVFTAHQNGQAVENRHGNGDFNVYSNVENKNDCERMNRNDSCRDTKMTLPESNERDISLLENHQDDNTSQHQAEPVQPEQGIDDVSRANINKAVHEGTPAPAQNSDGEIVDSFCGISFPLVLLMVDGLPECWNLLTVRDKIQSWWKTPATEATHDHVKINTPHLNAPNDDDNDTCITCEDNETLESGNDDR